MVVIEINKKDLLNLIGKELSDEQIEETLFLLKSETTINKDKIECELNPDRPDMFSVEGVAREMKGFLGIETGLKKYNISDSGISLKKEKTDVRPFISCGIIVDVKLTDDLIKSLMQIQEKLHTTIGRERRKVAIGVHDLEKIKPPLTYTDVEDEKFIPLGESKEMTIKEILENHPKGKAFAHLVKGKYPMIYDKDGVISFPPIINSERTKVTEKTKDLFIDVTGTDEKSVDQALNILVCSIAERGGKILTVKISNRTAPDLEPLDVTIDVEEINKILGLELNENQIAEIFERMRYDVKKLKGGKLGVGIPPYRCDILHKIDLIEDVAIGYGYNNIEPVLPKIATIGELSELEKFTNKIRELMIGLEFQEVLNFVLTSKENNSSKMNIQYEEVELMNPTSSEYNICRTWLLPSLLKVLFLNKNRDYPQRVFEIGDCVVKDESKESRTRDERKLAAVISYDGANLTEIKSIVEAVLKGMEYKFTLRDHTHSSFIGFRCGEIFINEKQIGFFGEVHPNVLEKWGIEKPVIAFEIRVD